MAALKVRTVPGEQVLHPIHGRNRNMQGIDYGVSRQRPRHDEGLGEPDGLLAQGQNRNALEGGETSCGRVRIARLGFLHDGRGHKQVKACALGMPPLLGNLLVGCGDEVTTGPCGEITDNGGFEVDFWLHQWTLYNLRLGVKI
jgi:hypothetical protein